MNKIKPKKLEKGDTIAILALSGALKAQDDILRAKTRFEAMGYKVVLSEHVFDKKRYLAGDDKTKISELHKYFQDPSVNAIICARGGYGAIRILNDIDYEIIKNNPKIFAGYSDVTAFESMFLKRAGLVTFYAPVVQNGFGAEEMSEISVNSFFETVTECKDLVISPEKPKVYRSGDAEGILWGGNLATVVSMCGMDFIPDEKFIFFAEDLGEEDYKIDKMMTQLLNIEKFRNNVQAIVLGDFLDVTNYDYLDEIFKEIAVKLQKPVIGGFKITHAKDKITIPYGADAKLINNTLNIASYLT